MISSLPVFYNGRLSDGRTPWLSVTDINVTAGHSAPRPAGSSGQLNLNVLNLFDQGGRGRQSERVETQGEPPHSAGNVLRRL